jgi:hypothetical protein
MAEHPPPDHPRKHLARIADLWVQLRQTRDPTQCVALVQQLREETDAYKQVTGHGFDPQVT